MANRKIRVWSRGLFIAEPSKENRWLMFKNTELLYDFGGEGFGVVFFFSSIYMYLAALGLSYSTQGLQFSLQHAGSLS